MELSNDFNVTVPVDEAWAILTDVERIAPCLPGAQLQEVEGDDYRGIVKVKVGPDHRPVQGPGHASSRRTRPPTGRVLAGRGPRHPGPGQRLGDHHGRARRARRRHRT